MVKNLMFIYITIVTVFRGVNLIFALDNQPLNLPVMVLVLTIITILSGLYIMIKAIIRKLNMFDLSVYAVLNFIIIKFNLLYISYNLPTELDRAEMLMVGSLLDAVICGLFLYHSLKLARKNFRDIRKENL